MKNLEEIAKQHSAVFVGPVRNCGPFLDKVLSNVEKIGSLFKSYTCVFVESDSSDNSLQILGEYASERNNVFVASLGKLEQKIPSRTQRIAVNRNAGIRFCEEHGLLDSHDFYIQMCVDDVNCQPIDTKGVLSCFKYDLDSWDCMTANQAQYYYDIWTLRCKNWIDFDCWEMVNTRPNYMSREKAIDAYVISRQLNLDPAYGLIEVDAAHGGLSIYKSSIVKGCRYNGVHPNGYMEESDIMSFCRGVKNNGGKIFINPEMINMVNQ